MAMTTATKTAMTYINHDDMKEEGSATRVCGAKLFTKLFPNTNNSNNKRTGSSNSSAVPFLTLTPSAVGTMSDSQHEHSDHHHHHQDHLQQNPSKDLFVVGSSIGTESFGSDAAANMEKNNNKNVIVVEGLGPSSSSSSPPATSSPSSPAINDMIAEDFFEQRLSNNSEGFLQFNPTILQDLKMKHGKTTTAFSTKNDKKNQGSRLNLPSLSSHIISKMDTTEKDNELISLSEHVRKAKIFGEEDGDDDDKVQVDKTTMNNKKKIQAKQSDDDAPVFPPFQLEEWTKPEVDESRTDDDNSNNNNGQRLELLDEERETLESEKMELAKEMEEFRNDLLQLKASLKIKNLLPVQLSEPTVVVPNESVQGGNMEYAGEKSIEMVSTTENVGRRFKKDWSLGFGQDGDEDKILMEEPSFIDDKKKRAGDGNKTKKTKSRAGKSLKPAAESLTDSADEVSTPELTEEILPGKKPNDFESEEKIANDQRIQDSKAQDRNPSACNLVQIAEQQGAVFAALHYESNSMNIGAEKNSQKPSQLAGTATNSSKNAEKKLPSKSKRNEELGSSKKANIKSTAPKQNSLSLAKTSKKTRKSGSKDDSLTRDEDEYARDMEQVQKLLKKYGFQKKSTKKFPSSYQDMEPHFGQSSQDDEDQAVVEIENLSAVSEHTSLYSDTDDPDLGFQMHAELCQKGTWKSNGSVHSGKRSSLRPRKYNASSSQSSRSKLESILKADDVEASDRVRFKKSIQSRVIVGGVHYDDEIRISNTPTPDPHDMSTIEERQDESESTPYGDLETSRDGSPSPEKKKVDSLIQYWECQGSN